MKRPAVPVLQSAPPAWWSRHSTVCFGLIAALWVHALYARVLKGPFLAFQNATEVNPGDATAYFDMAVTLQQRGQDAAALALYRKVLELKPNDPQTLLYISRLRIAVQ